MSNRQNIPNHETTHGFARNGGNPCSLVVELPLSCIKPAMYLANAPSFKVYEVTFHLSYFDISTGLYVRRYHNISD